MSDVVVVRNGPVPGDIGAITRLHGLVYAREQGWDPTFEAYVAEGLAKFVRHGDPARDRLWVVERGGEVAGSIAIQARENGAAQLRWYLLREDCRGLGLGRKLLDDAMAFCREGGVESVYLWTVAALTAAGRLYAAVGFRCVEEQTHVRWGVEVVEQRYEWRPGSGR